MKVAILGAGCIGLHLGGVLYDAYLKANKEINIRFIGRRRVFEAIRSSKELIVSNNDKKILFPADKIDFLEDINNRSLGDCDIIILTVKGFDTEEIAIQLSKLSLKPTGILLHVTLTCISYGDKFAKWNEKPNYIEGSFISNCACRCGCV